jgi:UDP-N-acetylglucosamine diphosphorylase/glucosamine-1-phosphate N-acetyltransferase
VDYSPDLLSGAHHGAGSIQFVCMAWQEAISQEFKKMRITVFDDNHQEHFFPLTQNRSLGDLRCGILKLRQRLQNIAEQDVCSIIIKPDLETLYQIRHKDWQINASVSEDTLYLNSRIKLEVGAKAELLSLKPGAILVAGDAIIAVRSDLGFDTFPDIESYASSSSDRAISSQISLYRHLADIIHDNSRLIRSDFEEFFYDEENFMETEHGVCLLDPYNIWIGEGASIKPGVVLDASEGPIVIDNDVVIMSNAVICGPVYIGKKSTIKIGAKIYPGTSIGPVCKIGGEVEGSIFQAYSNKQHEGFIGHSYIGEWVNIGADTNNSDLKNTYKNVSYYSHAHKLKVDSGTMFLGAVVADHVKFGINCTINTGCVIGLGSNLWGSDLISDYIPPFSWGQANQLIPYRLEAFLETVQQVKQRRGLSLDKAERELYSRMYSLFS